MNKIVPFDEYGIVEKNGGPMASSRRVAEVFGKQHVHVLESIRKILGTESGVSEDFGLSNFRLISEIQLAVPGLGLIPTTQLERGGGEKRWGG